MWQVPTKLEAWPETEGLRRASINNFGYGGSNAHVIVEDYKSFLTSSPEFFQRPGTTSNGYQNGITNGNGNGVANGYCSDHSSNGSEGALSSRSRVFLLSGKDERATNAMAHRLKNHLSDIESHDENEFLDNLAYTLGHRRSSFPWVSTFAADSISGLVKAIESGKAKPTKRPSSPRVGFVYTGQGAQWWAMGRELIDSYPVFKATLMDCDARLKKLGAEWNMIGTACTLQATF